jgi:Kef-type K+ transport system membrane component KefB
VGLADDRSPFYSVRVRCPLVVEGTQRNNSTSEKQLVAPDRSTPILQRNSPTRSFWPLLLYCLTVVAGVGCFLAIRQAGQSLSAPRATETERRAAGVDAARQGHTTTPSLPSSVILPHVLLTMAAVILLGQVLARLFVYLHQPPVIGEVVAGIMLGPSVLGNDLATWLLPAAATPFLEIIAQFGVILYMFLVGLELNPELFRGRASATIAIAHSGIAVPFVSGAGLALLLFPRLGGGAVSFTTFALFLGVSMSVTAFPVLARILTDRGISKTQLGVLALGCAAVGDVTAWCLLALATGVARARAGEAMWVTLGAAAYVGFMLVAVRPLARQLVARWGGEPMPRHVVAAVFIALLVSALATDWIGIHAIFGAFLLGAVIPHDSGIARAFDRQLSSLVTITLLPAFFALTGMRTRIDLVTGGEQWLFCGLIILVATAGKFGGTYLAAQLSGFRSRTSTALGALMNTRGLMELIVLNVGLELGVITPTLFSMLVIMALVTTLTTAPVLRLLTRTAQDSLEVVPKPERQ